MCLMEPNPHDWCTWSYAQRTLNASRQTVVTMVQRGALTLHRTRGGAPMFWVAEVEELDAARRRVSRGR